MKYLAILKDSLLEALDTKVFYAMAGVSCLVLIAVASVSYRPVTVEDEVRGFVANLSWLMGLAGGNKGARPISIEVEDFEQTNPGAPPEKGDYRFTLVMKLTDAAMAQKDRDNQAAGARKLQQALRGPLSFLNDLKVAPAEAPDPAELRYVVTSSGTKVTKAEDWPHEPTVFFAVPIKIWHAPVGAFVNFWEGTIVNTFGAAIALLISTIVTAFFIPNMLHKGTVDLLLVKPIHRTTLLLCKYLGGLLFMLLNTTFVVVGVWLILGLRTGMWGTGFLASIPVLTFQFAFYYAISTLFGVLTRSAIVAILMSCLGWFVFSFVIGTGYRVIDATRKLPEAFQNAQKDMGQDPKDAPARPNPLPDWVYVAADVVHFVTPRLEDLDALVQKLVARDTLPEFTEERRATDRLLASVNWTEAVGVTAAYIAVMLGIACWWFATKDY